MRDDRLWMTCDLRGGGLSILGASVQQVKMKIERESQLHVIDTRHARSYDTHTHTIGNSFLESAAVSSLKECPHFLFYSASLGC